jgi:peptide/nickel transport system substrate-binding protein
MKKISIFVAVLLLCAAFIAGCSNQSTTSATTAPTSKSPTIAPTSASTPSNPPSSTGAVKPGGTLRLIIWTSPSGTGGLPAELFANDALSSQLVDEPLLHVDPKGNVIPWLAESYKVASDLKSITFTLRKGVKFHDGTDFNAQAAKWNLDNTIASKSQPTWNSVDVIDDYTIRLNLSQWVNTIFTDLDSTASWMVSPTAFQKNGADWMRNNPVGTGPFKFVSFQRDVNYKMIKNPDYWIKGQPYLDAVEISYVIDPLTQKAAMQSGTADALQIETGKTAADLKALGFIIENSVNSTFCLLPDTANADSPFANLNVRQAVEYGIDREALASAFSYGFWQAPYQIPAPDNVAFNTNFALARKYDVAKAKQLLTDAGYSKGFSATLLVIPVGIDKNIPLAIQNNLSQIGITLDMNYPTNIPKWLEGSNTLHSVLVMEPFFGGVNWNQALAFALRPGLQNQNQVWQRTPEFINLYNASLSSASMDINLIRGVTDYLTQQAQVIPIFSGGSGYAVAPYVKDASWNIWGMNGWKSFATWLNK